MGWIVGTISILFLVLVVQRSTDKHFFPFQSGATVSSVTLIYSYSAVEE